MKPGPNSTESGPLTGRVVLVTGGAAGIGAATVRAFIDAGAFVAAVDIDGSGARKAVQQLNRDSHGHRAISVRADVARESDVARLLERIVGHWGHLDVVVSNAAVVSKKPVEKLDRREWDRVSAVNVAGLYLLAKHSADFLRESMNGAIVTVASVAGLMSQAGRPAYASSKGALMALSRSLAVDFAPARIRVNCVAPGIVDTPGLRRGAGSEPVETYLRRRAARVPMGRLVTADEVASAILFLASDAATGISGATLVVDGALSATYEYPPSTRTDDAN